MDARLLEYYNRELRYMRDLGGEFAKAFPKVAGRLGLDAFECADPYVERLLEGFAFLAARVQLKMDAEFPRFTEQLLEALCPHYLGPTPSMAVVQFKPDPKQGALSDGFVLPRGTSLLGNVRPGEVTACQYRTGHEVTLWPVELTGLTHPAYTGDLGQLRFPSRARVKGTLRARLRTTNGLPFSALSVEALTLFVRGNDALSLRLFELLLCGSVGVAVREPGTTSWVTGAAIQPVGFDDLEALLPCGPRSFQGYRLLHEYFAFPNRFLFATLVNLGPAVRQCRGQELEIAIALDRHEPAVETAINPGHLALFCAPAINLFPKMADRIHLSDRDHECHVVADRTRPMDFEVQSVLDVTGFGPRGDAQRHFVPLYTCHSTTDMTEDPAYFTVHRRSRRLSARQQLQGPRSSYVGGEIFVSLVDGREGPYGSNLQQLGVRTLCTNRDLPLRMPVDEGPTDFFVETGAPVESVRCVAGPSPPHPSHPPGDRTWRLINHLSLNYLSLTDAADGGGATALRDLLQLYADLSDTGTRRQIEGIRSAVGRPKVRRLPFDGPASFARGIEITLECDESAFEGTSVVLLGLVLDRFFSKYVSINSFAETVLRGMQRGEIVRWPPRIGRRPAT
ncbi:MAG: type VI secretion system baseplate subunit TssF [Myxococcota bacterium]|nr:type VI secretion system baseplate subunit TssF [Myxococcota bacterium]